MSRFSNSLLLRESSDGGSTTLWSTTKTTPPQLFKQTQRVIALNLIRIDDEEMMIYRFKVRKVSSQCQMSHTLVWINVT
jgi:hypothetical protein